CGIDYVDGLAASISHDSGLPSQVLRVVHMRQHQEAGSLHSQLASSSKMLLADVRLRAVRGDSRHSRPGGCSFTEIRDGAQAWKQEHGDLRTLGFVHGSRDQIDVPDGGETVIETGPGQSVTMGDLYIGHTSGIECSDHLAHLLFIEGVGHGMASVAERSVNYAHRSIVVSHEVIPSSVRNFKVSV